MDYIKLAKTTINLLDSMIVCGESHTTTSKEMMSNAQKGLSKLQEDIDVKNSVYCPACQSCGEEGCCSPTLCTNNKDGISNLKGSLQLVVRGQREEQRCVTEARRNRSKE